MRDRRRRLQHVIDDLRSCCRRHPRPFPDSAVWVIKEGLRMVPSFLAAGAGTGVPLFPGKRKNGVRLDGEIARQIKGICPTRDGAIPYAEAGSW